MLGFVKYYSYFYRSEYWSGSDSSSTLNVVLEDVGSYSQPTSSKLLHDVSVLYLKLHIKLQLKDKQKTPHTAFGIF